MHRLVIIASFFTLTAVVAGCASTPSRFYSLSAAAEPTAPSSNLSIAVGPVSVPAVVDRPQIVVNVGPNQVRLEEFNRWAAPLQNNIARVVASALGEAAMLDAVWNVRRTKDGKAETGRTTVRETVQEKGYDALAAAHSRALARLSRDIAAAVAALGRSAQ